MASFHNAPRRVAPTTKDTSIQVEHYRLKQMMKISSRKVKIIKTISSIEEKVI